LITTKIRLKGKRIAVAFAFNGRSVTVLTLAATRSQRESARLEHSG
jgi:hypothetical protein